MKRNKNFKIDKKWSVRNPKKAGYRIEEVPAIVTQVLAGRGFTEKEARDFLFCRYEMSADPYLLSGMEDAVRTIVESIDKKEKIAIYGDYDVDGITGTAILVRYFRAVGVETEYYIPSREGEGYGLNQEAVRKLAKEGVKLIITTDCGTSAEEEIGLCHELGLKIVITDHHEPRDLKEKPEALVNPKTQPGEPFTDLAGAGVAFYLVRALMPRFKDAFGAGQEKWLLDLAALGTICDIVPLKYDNRIIAKYGLLVMAKGRNLGLRTLARVAGFEVASVDGYKVGFLLGPRLNAAGRLEHAVESLRLLITEDEKEATEIALKLNRLNEERQALTEKIVTEAREAIGGMDNNKKIYLLSGKNWPAGVVGIAASRLVEEYGRPVLIMEDTGEFLKGSARSIKGFDITKALSQCRDCLKQYGGHAAAAGFTLKKDHFLLLDEKLVSISEKEITTTDLVPEIITEAEIDAEELTSKLARSLSLLEPFGPENPKPLFVLKDLVVQNAQLVGNPKIHLKLTCVKKGRNISAIGFNYGEDCDLKPGDNISTVVSVEENEWQGQKRVDLHLIDLKMNKIVEQNVDRTTVSKT
jgi:single-stranded-DNA-specific exonuclease